jgi:hypothetical protein
MDNFVVVRTDRYSWDVFGPFAYGEARAILSHRRSLAAKAKARHAELSATRERVRVKHWGALLSKYGAWPPIEAAQEMMAAIVDDPEWVGYDGVEDDDPDRWRLATISPDGIRYVTEEA